MCIHLSSTTLHSAMSSTSHDYLQLPTPNSSSLSTPLCRSREVSGSDTSSFDSSTNLVNDEHVWVSNPDSPSLRRARTLILCFDGTGDYFNDDNSNVIKFVSALRKDDAKQQLVYYQAGIGTYTRSIYVMPVLLQLSKLLDTMFAWNLSSHVMQGYKFLMQNYVAGDKICIFGFSRGAYTARALAGMIQKVGLLPACNKEQVPFAWAMYKRKDPGGIRNSAEFKKTFCSDVMVDFVGVWDTVESVGLSDPELPFTTSNESIRIFRHALSLDEHRVKFLPNFYHANTDDRRSNLPQKGNYQELIDDNVEVLKPYSHAQEVWFAGCHCDVGGGSVRNHTRFSLARIPLRWMIRECFRTETGIIFSSHVLKEEIGLDWRTVYPNVLDRPPRLRPSKEMRLEQPKFQGYTLTVVFIFLARLFLLPIQIGYHMIRFPFNCVWLLLRYSLFLEKWIPKSFPLQLATVSSKETDCGETAPFVSEEVEELNDALSAIYDQLSIRWFWWILEALPLRHVTQQLARDESYVRINMGRGREIYGDAMYGGLQLHRSVKIRMEALDSFDRTIYRPRASIEGHNGQTNWNCEDTSEWVWVS